MEVIGMLLILGLFIWGINLPDAQTRRRNFNRERNEQILKERRK